MTCSGSEMNGKEEGDHSAARRMPNSIHPSIFTTKVVRYDAAVGAVWLTAKRINDTKYSLTSSREIDLGAPSYTT